jgi:hypothetical protein
VQTFVPIASKDYKDIAATLDNKRLFKQALEAWQILMVLEELNPQGEYRKPKGWVNHPAVKMWRGNSMALYKYTQCMLDEADNRGINVTKMRKNLSITADALIAKRTAALEKQLDVVNVSLGIDTLKYLAVQQLKDELDSQVPVWQEFPEYYEIVASTHRQALLVKDYEHYKQFKWSEDTGVAPTEYEYLWPIEIQKV